MTEFRIACQQVILFSRTVLAEAGQRGVVSGCAAFFGCGLALAWFVGKLAIVETQSIQAGVAAAYLRLFVLFFLSLFTINSLHREMNDQVVLLYLSLPISRAIFVLGKFLGFALVGCILAIVCCVSLIVFCDFTVVAIWAVSLVLESWIVVGVSVLCALSFKHVSNAFGAVVGLYLLARSLSAIRLMSDQALSNDSASSQEFIVSGFLEILDYLLPRLDRFTRSEWLMYGDITSKDISFIGQQSVFYLLLLTSAILIDIYRKNF